MNREDKDYKRLQELMNRFLGAETMEEKYACNPEFLEVSQDILKREWEVLKHELKSVTPLPM